MRISERNIRQKIAHAQKPVGILFTAEWCRPCVETMKSIDADPRTAEHVLITIDVEKHPDIAASFGVLNLPTFMVFKNGKRIKTHVGALCSDSSLSDF